MEDVRVQVDEPGRDDLAPSRRSTWNAASAGMSRSTAAMRPRVDGDVEPALVAAAGVDDLAAADQQVESHASSSAARIMSSASSRRKP